jgi:CRISPR-associated endonuclease Cas1
LKRLVIIGADGYVSLSALEWLNRVKASIIEIDTAGNVLLASAPAGCDYPHLRRAQALAAFTDTGIAITRYLLAQKLNGQASVMQQLGYPSESEAIRSSADALDTTNGLDALRWIEAQAASIYWQALEPSPLRFARKDAAVVPAHWLTFGPRGSHIANGPRNASTPANAILNYLYAILEAEARVALLVAGLDPGIGILHTDQRSSDAMVYDVMESARSVADALTISLIRSQLFTRRDFGELSTGEVRLSVELRERLTDQAIILQQAVAPHVEHVAKMLSESVRPGEKVPTLLTQANRSHGRAAYRMNTVRPSKHVAPQVRREHRCVVCGGSLPDAERTYCDACFPDRNRESGQAYLKSAIDSLAELRASGNDPAHGGNAAKKRGETQRERARARAEWEAANGIRANGIHDDAAHRLLQERFRAELLPKLASVPLSQIRKATSMSLRYAALVRRGEFVPHPMHYDALARLVPREAS